MEVRERQKGTDGREGGNSCGQGRKSQVDLLGPSRVQGINVDISGKKVYSNVSGQLTQSYDCIENSR